MEFQEITINLFDEEGEVLSVYTTVSPNVNSSLFLQGASFGRSLIHSTNSCSMLGFQGPLWASRQPDRLASEASLSSLQK